MPTTRRDETASPIDERWRYYAKGHADGMAAGLAANLPPQDGLMIALLRGYLTTYPDDSYAERTRALLATLGGE